MLQPLLRIFEPILKNASKELLQGSHTRSVSISTPSNSGIMKFAKKQLSCLGCKAVIRLDTTYIYIIYIAYRCHCLSLFYLIDLICIHDIFRSFWQDKTSLYSLFAKCHFSQICNVSIWYLVQSEMINLH